MEDLDRRSTGAVAAVRRQFKSHGEDVLALSAVCTRAGANIRGALDKATSLVNHGEIVMSDVVQNRADLVMAKLSKPAA